MSNKYLPGLDPSQYPPEVEVVDLESINLVNQNNYGLSGKCSETVETIKIKFLDQERTAPCKNGQWSFNNDFSSLGEGSLDIEITAMDIFDQQIISQVSIIKDITLPQDPTLVQRLSPLGSLSNQGTADLEVAVVDGDYLIIYHDQLCTKKAAEMKAQNGVVDVLGIKALEGVNNFSAKVRDEAGNFSGCVSSSLYIVDTIAPVIPDSTWMASPSNGTISVDNTPEFFLNISGEEESVIRIYKDSSCSDVIGDEEVLAGQVRVNNISLALDGSDHGLNEFYATMEDKATNQSNCTNLDLSYTLGATGLASIDKISMVGNNVSTDLIALDNNVEVFLNEVQIGGVLDAGDLINFNSSQGDHLSCTGACYVVSEGNGTSAWASLAYAGKSFSTYVDRDGENQPRIYVAIFEDDTSVDLYQDGAVVRTLSGDMGDVILFEETIANRSVQLFSNKKIVAYFVSRVNAGAAYDQDARVLTPSAKEVIGLSGYITGTEDNTEVFSYRNNGTSYTNADLDLNQNRSTGGTSYGRYSVYAKADKPISITQTADGNGNNSTQSLPVSMLATNYGLSRKASYVSFSSMLDGTVTVIDPDGNPLTTLNFSKTGADVNTPYLVRYILDPNHPATSTSHPIVEGTTFICSVPCFAVYDDIHSGDDDETLMMGFTP